MPEPPDLERLFAAHCLRRGVEICAPDDALRALITSIAASLEQTPSCAETTRAEHERALDAASVHNNSPEERLVRAARAAISVDPDRRRFVRAEVLEATARVGERYGGWREAIEAMASVDRQLDAARATMLRALTNAQNNTPPADELVASSGPDADSKE